MNESSLNQDVSLISIGKDGVNPIITVNNFIKEHMPINKICKKENSFTKINEKEVLENKVPERNVSEINPDQIESVDEALLQELGKKILKDSMRSKSDPDFNKAPKNNERY